VRADVTPGVLQECIDAQAGGAVIISGGFAELGRSDIQGELKRLASAASFPLIGPNCLGLYAPAFVDTFFIPSERIIRPATGNVAVVSQSGGILVDQMIKFADEGVGISAAVSIGNKAVIGELDLLRHFAADPHTQVIAFYVEGFGPREGRSFVLEAASCPKPVIVMKSGKSEAGSRAVSSHTASLAGDYKVFSAILAQHGVVEAEDAFELVSFCEALSCYPSSIQGRIGIITGSGGHGAMAVDACAHFGLTTPAAPEALQTRIRESLSPSVKDIASLANPFDLTGSAVDEDFVKTAEHMGSAAEVDCIIMLLLPYMPGITMDIGARLSHVSRRIGKPIIGYVPHVEKYRILTEGFELNGIPVSPSIEGAVLMAESMRRCRPC
jgi:acetyltransferase